MGKKSFGVFMVALIFTVCALFSFSAKTLAADNAAVSNPPMYYTVEFVDFNGEIIAESSEYVYGDVIGKYIALLPTDSKFPTNAIKLGWTAAYDLNNDPSNYQNVNLDTRVEENLTIFTMGYRKVTFKGSEENSLVSDDVKYMGINYASSNLYVDVPNVSTTKMLHSSENKTLSYNLEATGWFNENGDIEVSAGRPKFYPKKSETVLEAKFAEPSASTIELWLKDSPTTTIIFPKVPVDISIFSLPDAQTDGRVFKGWKRDDADIGEAPQIEFSVEGLMCQSPSVAAGGIITLIPCYEEVNYVVTFSNPPHGFKNDPQKIIKEAAYGEKIEKPSDDIVIIPQPIGCTVNGEEKILPITFNGEWKYTDLDGNYVSFDFEAGIKSNRDLKPVFLIEGEDLDRQKFVTVNFYNYNPKIGTDEIFMTKKIFVSPQIPAKAVAEKAPPSKKEYTFEGWTELKYPKEDGKIPPKFDFNTTLTEDLNLYSIYTNSPLYKLTLIAAPSQGGKFLSPPSPSAEYNGGQDVSLEVRAESGYNFKGFIVEPTPDTPPTVNGEKITVYFCDSPITVTAEFSKIPTNPVIPPPPTPPSSIHRDEGYKDENYNNEESLKYYAVKNDSENRKISKKILLDLNASNYEAAITVENLSAKVCFVFSREALKLDHSNEYYDFGVMRNVSAYAEEIVELSGENRLDVLHFSHTGSLPGKATLKIFAGKDLCQKTLYYYYYNPAENQLELVQKAIVDKEGYFAVEQTHTSDYVVTSEPVMGAKSMHTAPAKPLLNPSTEIKTIDSVILNAQNKEKDNTLSKNNTNYNENAGENGGALPYSGAEPSTCLLALLFVLPFLAFLSFKKFKNIIAKDEK